ncbi:MAG TPA: class I SAM-dependent methyltransferase [Acidimicrobiales bacterium]|nr:class I SAM-dependent methyltransferase [Acidimicrobiales bacterium]
MLTVDYERLGIRPGHRLLDVGAGAGRHAVEALRRGAAVAAVDLDEASLKDAFAVLHDARGELIDAPPSGCIRASALELPFDDASFDRIIAAEVLEHIDDDAGALVELARVLRPGGLLAVTIPRWFPEVVNWALSSDYHAPAVPGGHVRIYRESTLRHRLAAAGLHVVDRHHAHGLHSPYWWLRCVVGVRNEDHPLVRRYHSLLVRQMVQPRRVISWLDHALEVTIGKSLVLYAVRSTP